MHTRPFTEMKYTLLTILINKDKGQNQKHKQNIETIGRKQKQNTKMQACVLLNK